jgi:hypothetical protein
MNMLLKSIKSEFEGISFEDIISIDSGNISLIPSVIWTIYIKIIFLFVIQNLNGCSFKHEFCFELY